MRFYKFCNFIKVLFIQNDKYCLATVGKQNTTQGEHIASLSIIPGTDRVGV